jgi:hypothetical protein
MTDNLKKAHTKPIREWMSFYEKALEWTKPHNVQS